MQKMFFLVIISLFFGCENTEKPVVSNITNITGKTMGTYYSIKIAGENVNKEKLSSEVDKLLKDFNQVFSTYINDSELSRINQQNPDLKIHLSSEMNEVLLLSKKLFKETKGAFDPTVGPIVNRWGFGPTKDLGKPSSDEIKVLMQKVGAKYFNLNNGVLTKQKAQLYIDLSAIAKGYAVDMVADYLRLHKGLKNILVEIGGEVKAQGRKAESLWAIGIEKPSNRLGSGIQKVVPLLNKSVATSGSYRNYLKYGDKVFSHTINPKTGMPVEHKLVSVTVIETKCAVADALATALMVMGPKKGLEYAQSKGHMAYFLVKTDSGFNEISSTAFKKYMLDLKR